MNDTWYTKGSGVRRVLGRTGIAGGLTVAAGIACCGSGGGEGSRELSGVREAEKSVVSTNAAQGPEKAAAVVANSEVSWEELRPRLAEASGGMVLEEVVLERSLRQEMKVRGFEIRTEDVAAERERLVESLQRNAAADREQSARLITGLQRSRGYGPVRFAALLERNAMLRRLVKDEVVVDAGAVEREIQVRYGPKKRCRLIMVGTEAEATRLRARLLSPEGGNTSLEDRFAAEARTVSLDPSSKEGGVLPPISGVDVSYAAGVRRALADLAVGQVSSVVVLDRGFALLYGMGDVAGGAAPAGASQQIEGELRLRQERVAMDRLAQRLVNSANPTVLDGSLNWSWENRGR